MMFPSGRLLRNISIAVRPVVRNGWSMRSLWMRLLGWRSFVANTTGGSRHLGVRGATETPSNTSMTRSPPAGRLCSHQTSPAGRGVSCQRSLPQVRSHPESAVSL